MYSIVRATDFILSWLCIPIMGILAFLVLATTFLRYLFGITIIEMEETVCILFCATTFFGMALGIREKSHIAIPTFTESLAPPARRAFRILSMLGIIAVAAAVCWTSIQWIARIGGTNSLSLQIPCGYYYFMVPLSIALVVFYSILDIVAQFVPVPEADKGYVADAELADFDSVGAAEGASRTAPPAGDVR